MKTILFNTVRILLLLGCALFWTGCDDDEGGGNGKNALVGTWSSENGNEETIFILNKNGTFSIIFKEGGEEKATDSGNWTFDDPQLFLNFDNPDLPSAKFTVVSASSTSLVLQDDYEDTIAFNKIGGGNPSDDPGNSGIVGTWSPTTIRMVVPALGVDQTISAAEAEVFSSVTFKSDGTFTIINPDGPGSGRYTYSNNKLDMGDGMVYTVSLSGNKAELKWTEVEEGYTGTFYMTVVKTGDVPPVTPPTETGSFNATGKWFNSNGNSAGAVYVPEEVSTEIEFNGSTGVITKKTDKSIYQTANIGDVVVRNIQKSSDNIFTCEAMVPRTGEWKFQSQIVYTPYYNEMITIHIMNEGQVLLLDDANFFRVK
ncbi:MAG: hypothetical protein LBR52_01595 [Prevotellaceae bacterium]|jgi:hypothetical protein|nr:hypothetical protein [Prevotellaceae bacterium]